MAPALKGMIPPTAGTIPGLVGVWRGTAGRFDLCEIGIHCMSSLGVPDERNYLMLRSEVKPL